MKGSYFLIIFLEKDKEIKIGKLGAISFRKGFYIYVGSARGKSTNLENRIRRHLSDKKKRHWHIDYFLLDDDTKILKVFYIPLDLPLEEKISLELSRHLETIRGFGSSDLNVKGNLFYSENIDNLMKAINIVSEKLGLNILEWKTN